MGSEAGTDAKTVANRSEEIIRKHKEFLWPAVTNYYQQPLVADHGSMQYLWDVEGRRYLDFFGGIVTIGVGHCNPKVTTKIKAQVDKLQHTSTLFPNEAIVALAEKLAEITPRKLQKSFFTSSGTEANEAAILLARMASPSYDIVALRHGYSGEVRIGKVRDSPSSVEKRRSDQRGRVPRDQSLLLPLPATPEISRMRRGMRAGRGEPDPNRHQRLDCGIYRGTDSGGGWIHHAAAGVFQDASIAS